jgi:predicted ATPase/class 3 adenylate cyclase
MTIEGIGMRCPNCQTVNPPNAKFCLECGNRLLVCPNCGTVNLPVAKFCIECGTPLQAKGQHRAEGEPTAPLQPTETQSTPPASPAAPALAQVASPTAESALPAPEERRIVTIMFADITGSTPLADRLDPEDMRAILSGYFNLMTEQIRRHGGTVEKYIGDAVMAVFGAPIAHEDDPDRAIRAALDMQTALADFNRQRQAQDPDVTRLQMRIGINTGEVAAAPGSEFNRQDFLITGDAVNVAARLQQVATPDTILVGERTYLATREVFDFRAIAPLQIKGKAEPIAAWVVQGLSRGTPAITQHPRGIKGLEARFIGRTLELTLMHATYARVQAERRPHLITLLGVPGIGKSRLVREFIASEQEKARATSSNGRLPGPRVLQGRCPPYGEGLTYWPLVEIIRSLIHAEDGEGPETVKKRFIQFVHDTLTRVKRGEEVEQVTNALLRSIGRWLSGNINVQRAEDSTIGTALASASALPQRGAYNKSSEQNGPQVALLRAWRIFLEVVAQQQPLILVIDDLQWADEALLDLLEYLIERMTDVPILFICPARPDFFERRRDWGGGRRNFTTIALEALSTEQTSELVNELLQTDELPDVLRLTILSRAEGNPFFVEEIVRMLIDQRVLVSDHGCWHLSTQNDTLLSDLANPASLPGDTLIDQHYVLPLPRLPDTIQGVLAARIDLLSQIEKQVLQHASVMGRTFWLSGLLELASTLDAKTVLATLDTLIQHEFIVEAEKQGRSPIAEDRIFSFKHVLIRDVVYNNMPRMRRSQEHARLALWIEAHTVDNETLSATERNALVESFAELLAYHYHQALTTWSAGFLLQPVRDKAGVQGANGTQGDTSSPVIRLTRSELRQRTIKYLTMAGDQALHSYYTIRAIQAYSEALELLNDSDAEALTLAQMHEKLGDAYAQRFNGDEAWQAYCRALELMTGEQEADKFMLLNLYGRLAELPTRWLATFNHLPDFQEVRSYIDMGLQLLEGEPANCQRVAFLTYQALWYIRQIEYKLAAVAQRAELATQALESGKEALRIAEKLNDTYSLWIALDALGFIYHEHRMYLKSHEVQHRRLELASSISSREETHDLYVSLGYVHERIGDYSTAAKWYGRAWRIAQTMESPSMLLDSMQGRMYVWYQWNRWDEVRDVAEHMLQIVEQYQQDDQWTLEALEALADIAYRTGNEEQGDRYARQYKRVIEQKGGSASDLPLSIYIARKDWTRALECCKELLARSEPFPRPAVLANLAELLVITGEPAGVQQSICERAVSVAEQSGARKSLLMALRARGRMYLDLENWEAAERDLRHSLELAVELDVPLERGLTLNSLGLFYRRQADMVHQEDATAHQADMGLARYYFEQALGFFEYLKAESNAERVRNTLAQNHQAPV